MAILIDAKQLSKHKYVVEFDRIDMGIPASAVNVLAYKWGWNDALDSVESFAPIADAEPVKHGHWIDINENGSLWECSICGDRSCCCGNYCMECGTKMDEEANGNN